MTPPTGQQELAGLAALSGANPELPEPGLQTDLLRLRLITEALGRGATWAQIGSVLGYDGPKTTKAAAKRLRRRCSAAVIQAAGSGD